MLRFNAAIVKKALLHLFQCYTVTKMHPFEICSLFVHYMSDSLSILSLSEYKCTDDDYKQWSLPDDTEFRGSMSVCLSV